MTVSTEEILRALETTSTEVLRNLNHSICAILKHRSAMAACMFSPGDKVQFYTKQGHLVVGEVDHVMQKNVALKPINGVRWKVSGSLLKKVA